MSGWISLLKKCISIFIPKEINFIKIDNFHNTKQKFVFIDRSKTLNINKSLLTPLENKNLGRTIRAALDEDGVIILEKESNKQLEQFKKFDKSTENKKQVEFLKKIIPPEDIKIWRAAIYLRNCFNKGKPVDHLKQEIIMRYGDKGRNIANVCSAGYINKFLVPLYEYASENIENEDAKQKLFKSVYENLVEKLQFSIFVHSQTTVPEIVKEVKKKIQYRVHLILIHGVGRENVDKIKKA